MDSVEAGLADLIAAARAYTASGLQAFGYVEAGEVAIAAIPDALITARRYVDGPKRFTGAVYDGGNQLVRSSLGFSEGDYTPLDLDEIFPEHRIGGRRLKQAVYGGTLYPVLGHFLFETVARLWHGMAFAPRRGRLPVVFHTWPEADLATILGNPLYRATLAALGIRRGDIVLADADLAVETLYYPTPLSQYHVSLHPMMGAVLDHLAAELQRSPLSVAALRRRPAAGRVYLSRSRWVMNRRVRNEIALEDALAAQGFAIVHPQQLSPAALVRVLQGAEIVASIDGSQAHLVAFCRPGTRTLLFDTRPVPTQFAIERMRGLRGLHLPVYDNGMWDAEDGTFDLSDRTERLFAALLAPGSEALFEV